jgi:hypothetical protein
MDRQLALLESDVNCFKREKEVMEQNFNRRRQQLLDQSMHAVIVQQHNELIRQLMELNNQHQQDLLRINSKIYNAIVALNNKKRQLQQ